MSFSNNQIDIFENKRSQSKQKERTTINPFINKRYSPTNNKINNMNLIQNQETSASGITNITTTKAKEREFDFPYFSFPVKPLEEYNIENFFIKKNKKLFESPKVLNNKMISFQRQNDKQILEFPLFDDKIIFKDINKAYLQDEKTDDGDESSDEKINLGKNLLFQEIEQSSNELKESLNINKYNNTFLSRNIRFREDNNNK